uniref:Uncharacterized protein n=1 Tax=Solanum tuberosum TaxID=4113 RepID=M1DR50_SOLTU
MVRVGSRAKSPRLSSQVSFLRTPRRPVVWLTGHPTARQVPLRRGPSPLATGQGPQTTKWSVEQLCITLIQISDPSRHVWISGLCELLEFMKTECLPYFWKSINYPICGQPLFLQNCPHIDNLSRFIEHGRGVWAEGIGGACSAAYAGCGGGVGSAEIALDHEVLWSTSQHIIVLVPGHLLAMNHKWES